MKQIAKPSISYAVAAAVVLFAVGTALATDPVTVDNVTDLTNQLDRLNRTRDSSSTVILKKGFYDVSGCAMEWDNETAFQPSLSHLALSHVTLRGETDNPRDTVIYGNHTQRILHMNASTLANLTVSNGYADARSGAGVYCRWNLVNTLTNVVVTCCELNGGDGGAGVGYATYVRDCQIVGNYSSSTGGGVGNIGTSVRSDAGVYGGLIADNESARSGGGMINGPLYGVTLRGNVSGTLGGGVYLNSGSHPVLNCTIISNSAVGGGGYATGGTGNSFVISNSLIACNWARSAGGGVFIYSIDTLVKNCIVSNNACAGIYTDTTWTGGGGGISGVTTGYGKVVGCSVMYNIVTNHISEAYGSGGGVFLCMEVTNCVIVGNHTENSGGGAARSTLVGCVVSNNVAQRYGGGVYRCAATRTPITLNLIKNINGVTKVAGGGGASDSFVTNSIVAGNAVMDSARVSGGSGGGGCYTEFSKCEIHDNYASSSGAMYDGSAIGCRFWNNATEVGGTTFRNIKRLIDCDIKGAVLDWPGCVVGCKIHDYSIDGYATIEDGANVATSGVFKYTGTISNYAPTLLHTVVNAGSSCMAVTNTIFYNNHVSSFFYPTVDPTFVNCQFVSNRAERTCTNVGMAGQFAEIVNTIFVGNKTRDGASDRNWYPDWGGDTNVIMRNCIVGPGLGNALPRVRENTVFDQDIRFVADDEWPYRPAKSRYVRGQGLVQDWMSDAFDIRGSAYPRLRDGKVDIGAYQNWDPVLGLSVIFK